MTSRSPDSTDSALTWAAMATFFTGTDSRSASATTRSDSPRGNSTSWKITGKSSGSSDSLVRGSSRKVLPSRTSDQKEPCSSFSSERRSRAT